MAAVEEGHGGGRGRSRRRRGRSRGGRGGGIAAAEDGRGGGRGHSHYRRGRSRARPPPPTRTLRGEVAEGAQLLPRMVMWREEIGVGSTSDKAWGQQRRSSRLDASSIGSNDERPSSPDLGGGGAARRRPRRGQQRRRRLPSSPAQMRSTAAGPPQRWSTTTAATGERGSRRGGRGGARGADAGTTVAGAVLPSTTVLPCHRAPCCHPRPPSYCRAGAAVETRTTRGRRRRRRKM